MRGQRSSSECASHGRIPGGEALHPSVFGQLGRQHSRSSKQGHHQRNHFSRRRTIDARSLLQAATANTTMDQGSEGTTENSRSCRSLALYSHIFSLSSHVRSIVGTVYHPFKVERRVEPSGHVWACCCAARSTHVDGARGGWCQGARLAESSPRPQAHSVGRSALQPRRQPQRLALALALTWGATV